MPFATPTTDERSIQALRSASRLVSSSPPISISDSEDSFRDVPLSRGREKGKEKDGIIRKPEKGQKRKFRRSER